MMAQPQQHHLSAMAKLRSHMELCSQIVSDSYDVPPEELQQFEGELPPGHTAGHRRQRYWVTEAGGDLVVALPGTTHPLDWSSNMCVRYTPVDGSHPAPGTPTEVLEQTPCAHAGFYFRAETVPTLALLEQAAAKGLRLVLTGHSLGGAVANLCALTALRAQQKARDAAADAAEQQQQRQLAAAAAAAAAQEEAAAAGGLADAPPCGGQRDQATKRSASRFVSAAEAAQAAAQAASTNHSYCSANSDILVSPQAALVEVLCVSFASPHWANASLARMLEAAGWDECFVNVVVPEDYCLKLFNNVLTSAPPSEHNLSRSASSASSAAARVAQPADDSLESLEAYQDDAVPSELLAGAGELPAAAAGSYCSSCSGGEQEENEQEAEEAAAAAEAVVTSPRFSYNSNSQQPLASAMAGSSTRKQKQKKQLSFASPLLQRPRQRVAPVVVMPVVAAVPAAADVMAAAPRPVVVPPPSPPPPPSAAAATIAELAAAAEAGSWGDVRAALPVSPSSGSLSSLTSWNSTRSWTLLAYLPDAVLRSFGGSSAAAAAAAAAAASTSLTPASRAEAAAAAGQQQHSGSSSRSSSKKGWGAMRHAKSSINLHTPESESTDSLDSSSTSSSDGLAADDAALDVQGQSLPASKRLGLRRTASSASMKIFERSHTKLLAPLASSLKLSGSSLALVSALLPSMRSLAHASRAVLATASSLADCVRSVPLTVFELGLIKALKPPMYCSAGQQWILSATGLVPQHQPINLYPKHVHDVFWHKELALVAFREHSILFYKRRLLQQASRR